MSKLNTAAESGVSRLMSEPGSVAVDAVDTLLMQNNPANPVGWVGNAIRGGIGNNLLNNNSTILTDPRNSDGSFKTNWTDRLFKVDAEEKKERALRELKQNDKFRDLRTAGYDFETDKGQVKGNADITAAIDLVNQPEYAAFRASGGDTSKIDLDTATVADLVQATKVQTARNTIERLGPAGSGEGLTDQQLLGLADAFSTEKKKKKTASNPLNAASIRASDASVRQAEAAIRQGDERTKLDLLGVQSDLALGKANLDLQKATTLMQAEQANLDREYADRRDQRDYDYRIKKDDMESMDKIFAMLLGGVKAAFI